MSKFIILLRGINVSGKNKIPMAELRNLLDDLGFKDVQTYIQSGNIILSSDASKSEICNKINKGIKETFGFDVPVIIRTKEEWKQALKKYPFSKENEKIVAFTFLNEKVNRVTIDISSTKEDIYKIDKDVVFLNCPTGFGKTKLTNNLFERKFKVITTTRNLKTTTRNLKTTMKLLELAE